MTMPAARLGDFHMCPMVTPAPVPVPHVGGPVIKGEFTVLTGMMPQARITDNAICVGPPDMIAKGSATVLVGKLPAARIVMDTCMHGGMVTVGCFTVLIGG